MQTALQATMEKNEYIAPLRHAAPQGRQTFELAELITDFCSWYKTCLGENHRQVQTTISGNIPQHVLGNKRFMKHLLFEVGRCSLLASGSGDIAVNIEARQQTSRRHSLRVAISVAGATLDSAAQKELFQAGPALEHGDSCRLRIANLYYPQMIAQSFGGDIHIEPSTGSGVRYLLGINIFTRPS